MNPDRTRRLPVELFTYVLDCLTQPDVLRAAGVCRRWRVVAQRHKRFYRYISYGHPEPRWWYYDSKPSLQDELQPMFWRSARSFQLAVEEAKATSTPVSLCIRIAHCPHGSVVFASSLDRKVRGTLLGLILPALQLAVPLACKLHLELPRIFGEPFMDAIASEKAPLLRHFYLYGEGAVGIPSTVFAGSAPRLRTVSCEGSVTLPDDPILAFSRVTNAEIRISSPSLTAAASHFLDIRHLTCDIGYLSDVSEESLTPKNCELLTDLVSRLQSLSITVEVKGRGCGGGSPGELFLQHLFRDCQNVRSVNLCLRGAGEPPSLQGFFTGDTKRNVRLTLDKATSAPIGKLSYHSEQYYHDFSAPFAGVHLSTVTPDDVFCRSLDVHGLPLDWCFKQLAPLRDEIVELSIWHGYLEPRTGLTFLASLPHVQRADVDLCEAAGSGWSTNRTRKPPIYKSSIAPSAESSASNAHIPSDGDKCGAEKRISSDKERATWWPRLKRLRVLNSRCTTKNIVVTAEDLRVFAETLDLSITNTRTAIVVDDSVEFVKSGT